MGINKSLKQNPVPVMWGDEEAAVVRGLLPSDIADIVRLAGHRIHDILATLDELDIVKAGGTVEEAADRLIDELPKAISRISMSVPELVALIIAYAADEADPSTIDYIRDTWPVSVQADALASIARETFVDDEGFRRFVGNVVAVLQSGNALVSTAQPRRRTVRAPESSAAG